MTAISDINVGVTSNDHTGDDLRTAGGKINTAFHQVTAMQAAQVLDEANLATNQANISTLMTGLVPPSTDPTGVQDSLLTQAVYTAGNSPRYMKGNYYLSTALRNVLHQFMWRGAGINNTIVTLVGSTYAIDTAVPFDGTLIEDMTITGGLGFIRSTFTGNLDLQRKVFRNLAILGFTECAINTNHNDCPVWTFEDLVINCLSSATASIGVALGRNSDASVFTRCSIVANYGVKLRASGLVTLEDCDFSYPAGGTNRAAIWVCGNNNNYTLIHGNTKLGNEQMVASDRKVLVRPELSGGTWNGDTLPDFAATSMAGNFTTRIEDNYIACVSGAQSVLEDVSGSLGNSSIKDNTMSGSSPTYYHYYAPGPSAYVDKWTENLQISNNQGVDNNGNAISVLALSNLGYFGYERDPTFVMEGDPRTANQSSVTNIARVGEIPLLTTPINAFTLFAATSVAVADASGEMDAANFTISATSFMHAPWATPPIVGQSLFIEFDVMAAPSTPVAQFEVAVIQTTGATTLYWSRPVIVPSAAQGWAHYCYEVKLNGSETSQFTFHGLSSGNVIIGKVRACHSRAPIPYGPAKFDRLMLMAPTTSTSATGGSASAVPAQPLTYITVPAMVNGTLVQGKIPYFSP